MRINTSLNYVDMHAAARRAGVVLVRFTEHGSRKSPRAFDVLLSGSGITGGQWGNSGTYGAGPYKAATWDEWGIFLDVIFRRDPQASCRAYSGQEEFQWATGNRYDTLTPERQHIRHKWSHDGIFGLDYSTQRCACGAIRRWVVRGEWSPDVAVEALDLYRESDENYSGPYASDGRYEIELARSE